MTKRKKAGVGSQMPKGEARPLGTKKGGKKNLTLVEKSQPEEKISAIEKNAGQPAAEVVSLTQSAIKPNGNEEVKKERDMTLTFKALNRKGTAAIYSGIKTSVRFPLVAFENKQYPQTLELNGPFAVPAAKTPKVKMTAEERKALRASQPKPTLAERIAKREASLAALRAKAAKEAGAASQPSL